MEGEAIDLPEHNRDEFLKYFNRQREVELDCCHGVCWLRKPEYAKIVADSLMHFDGIRYYMGDFVVMPNHFHALVAFGRRKTWRSNLVHGCTGLQPDQSTNGHTRHFWQQEPFDHLVRSVEQYEYLRQYIADNPQKAHLQEGEYFYRRLATNCR